MKSPSINCPSSLPSRYSQVQRNAWYCSSNVDRAFRWLNNIQQECFTPYENLNIIAAAFGTLLYGFSILCCSHCHVFWCRLIYGRKVNNFLTKQRGCSTGILTSTKGVFLLGIQSQFAFRFTMFFFISIWFSTWNMSIFLFKFSPLFIFFSHIDISLQKIQSGTNLNINVVFYCYNST